MSRQKKICIIGWPVAHSRSPLIHNYWIKKYGIENAVYEIKPIETDTDLTKFLSELHKSEYIGANVTIPHKHRAYKFILANGKLHGDAKIFHAVNTIWLDEKKLLHGKNTDALGFLKNLKACTKWLPGKDDTVTILGAGGAARAVVAALWKKGCHIKLVNRSFDNAKNLEIEIQAIPTTQHPIIEIFKWAERNSALQNASLLVNTTSLGMKGHDELSLNLENLPSNAIVYDLVYVPVKTQLLMRAEEHRLRTVDGLGMLLHQAVPGFKAWFPEIRETPKVTDELVTDELRALVMSDIAHEIEGGV